MRLQRRQMIKQDGRNDAAANSHRWMGGWGFTVRLHVKDRPQVQKTCRMLTGPPPPPPSQASAVGESKANCQSRNDWRGTLRNFELLKGRKNGRNGELTRGPHIRSLSENFSDFGRLMVEPLIIVRGRAELRGTIIIPAPPLVGAIVRRTHGGRAGA